MVIDCVYLFDVGEFPCGWSYFFLNSGISTSYVENKNKKCWVFVFTQLSFHIFETAQSLNWWILRRSWVSWFFGSRVETFNFKEQKTWCLRKIERKDKKWFPRTLIIRRRIIVFSCESYSNLFREVIFTIILELEDFYTCEKVDFWILS